MNAGSVARTKNSCRIKKVLKKSQNQFEKDNKRIKNRLRLGKKTKKNKKSLVQEVRQKSDILDRRSKGWG